MYKTLTQLAQPHGSCRSICLHSLPSMETMFFLSSRCFFKNCPYSRQAVFHFSKTDITSLPFESQKRGIWYDRFFSRSWSADLYPMWKWVLCNRCVTCLGFNFLSFKKSSDLYIRLPTPITVFEPAFIHVVLITLSVYTQMTWSYEMIC